MGVVDRCASAPWIKILMGCCCCIVIVVGALFALSFVTIVTGVTCGVNVESNARVLVNSSNFGGPTFTRDNMTVLPPQSLYSRLREELYDNWTHETSGNTYGYAGVHEAPMILYNGTKIAGNWEHVPSAIKGVFWMQTNGVPEILATLQYGEWFPEERILLLPNTPFSMSWYGNETPPSGTSEFASAYSTMDAKGLAESQGEGNITVAVAFKPCPEEAGFREPTVCDIGSDDFTFADIQSHTAGDLTTPSVLTSYVTWRMEENMSAVDRHSLWYRRVTQFCGKVGFGNYWLTKIIDEDGSRIEPYYSEYVEYLEGASQIIWSGLGPGHHVV